MESFEESDVELFFANNLFTYIVADLWQILTIEKSFTILPFTNFTNFKCSMNVLKKFMQRMQLQNKFYFKLTSAVMKYSDELAF